MRSRVVTVVSERDLADMRKLTSDHGAMCPCDTCITLRGDIIVRRRKKGARR